MNVTLPEVALHRFHHGQVSSVSHSVILSDDRLAMDRVTTVKPRNADYSGAHVIHHGDQLALVRVEEPERLEKGILVNGCNEVNYYHWVVEIVAQLQFISELPAEYADYPILISRNSQKIASIRALIECLDVQRPMIYLDTLRSYQVDDLLLITPPNNMIQNFKNSVSNLTNSSYARPESIQYLRNRALSLIDNVDHSLSPKRVFLARKGFLRRYNQDAVIALLQPYGFECVYMENLDVRQQISIMANADVIIGPTGAAWTNIMFASPGAQALCWMAEEYGDLSCFSNLADIVGVDLAFISYVTGAQSSRELYYKSYELNAAAVLAWLQEKLPEGRTH